MSPEFGHLFDHLPLIPEAVLRKHHVHQPIDMRFRAAAKLLPALWRSDRGLAPAPTSAPMATAALRPLWAALPARLPVPRRVNDP